MSDKHPGQGQEAAARGSALSQSLRRISFWIGVASAVAMLLTPIVWQWLAPPAAPPMEEGKVGFLSFALLILGSLSDGIVLMVWVAGLAAIALLASIVALFLAWRTSEPPRTKLLCLLPVAMVSMVFGLLVALDV